MAHQEKASTASKPTLEDEENWDEDLLLLPQETLPGMRPILPSQEDEWKLMVDQDPHSRSVAGDSGHGLMATTSEAKPIDSNEELIGAVGGIDDDAQCVQSIMQPLQQAEISFLPHAVLGYAMSAQSRSTSVKTDICADISSLLSSVGSAGDMPQPDN